MSSPTDPRQTIDASADPATAKFASSLQEVPFATSSNIYITNINEYTTIRVSDPGQPSGNTSEVQFNLNGRMSADDGLTYNPTTDSLDVLGNLTAGTVFTNNLKYANGSNWTFSGSSYSNSNVQSYLPTYTGNFNVNRVTATAFIGSGANLTDLPAGNILGSVAVAAVANSVAGANVTGTVSKATVADSANSVAGSNVVGTVSSATSAGSATTAATVTTAAQPNITSVGTLTGLTVSNSTGVVNFVNTANVSLGSIANLKIGGGTNGQVLTATGSGNTVQWSTPTAGNLQDITTNGSTTDRAISITNATISTSYTNGALVVTGGLGVGNAIHGNQHITARTSVYAGALSDFSSWTVPKFIGRDAGAAYIQGALINTTTTGSADWVAYGDQSDDANGWMDMGFTGTAFNDPLYTITKENDGYIICQGMPTQGGNLVIATGEKGGSTHRDIVFATGGFLIENEKMRLNHEDSTLYVGAHGEAGGTNVVDLDVNGDTELRGNLKVTKRSDLGSASNVYITGGTTGQVLSTDGAGNLSWTSLANAIVWTTAPVSNVSTGTAGEVAYDAGGNLFVCVATDTWSKFTGTTSW